MQLASTVLSLMSKYNSDDELEDFEDDLEIDDNDAEELDEE
jgi:hypothetical protein